MRSIHLFFLVLFFHTTNIYATDVKSIIDEHVKFRADVNLYIGFNPSDFDFLKEPKSMLTGKLSAFPMFNKILDKGQTDTNPTKEALLQIIKKQSQPTTCLEGMQDLVTLLQKNVPEEFWYDSFFCTPFVATNQLLRAGKVSLSNPESVELFIKTVVSDGKSISSNQLKKTSDLIESIDKIIQAKLHSEDITSEHLTAGYHYLSSVHFNRLIVKWAINHQQIPAETDKEKWASFFYDSFYEMMDTYLMSTEHSELLDRLVVKTKNAEIEMASLHMKATKLALSAIMTRDKTLNTKSGSERYLKALREVVLTKQIEFDALMTALTDLEKKNPGVHWLLYYDQAYLRFISMELDPAITTLDRGIKAIPGNKKLATASAYLNAYQIIIGHLEPAQQEKYYDKIIEVLRPYSDATILELNDSLLLAKAYYHKKDWENVQATFARAPSDGKNFELELGRGLTLMHQDKLQDSLGEFGKCITLAQNDEERDIALFALKALQKTNKMTLDTREIKSKELNDVLSQIQ